MLIETAVLNQVAATSGVTDLVASRIYYVRAPQSVAAPYVILSMVSSVPWYVHGSKAGLIESRLQVSIFAATYASVKAISVAIRTSLECFVGTMGGAGGIYVGVIFFDGEVDLPFDDELKFYGVADDYKLIYNE